MKIDFKRAIHEKPQSHLESSCLDSCRINQGIILQYRSNVSGKLEVPPELSE